MPEPSSPKPKKNLDQLRDAIRIKHYSYSTEKIYIVALSSASFI